MSGYGVALMTALYTALTTPALSGVTQVVSVPIADPAEGDYPFVHIGEAQTVPDDAVASGGLDDGVTNSVDVHVWTRGESRAPATAILDAIYGRLHQSPLTVSGRASALCWVRSSRLFTDADGLSQHGIITLDITHRS